MFARAGVIVVLGIGCWACGAKTEEAQPPVRAENPALAVAVAVVPAGAEVINQGDRFELSLPQAGSEPTRCRIAVGPEVRGVNLVEEVANHKALFEGLEGGEVVGTTELGGPLGPAYLVRGRYLEAGVLKEEMRILTLHPTDSKTLVLHCAYARANDEDSKARFAAVVGLLGELEAVAGAG
jgi:hypothetical protein